MVPNLTAGTYTLDVGAFRLEVDVGVNQEKLIVNDVALYSLINGEKEKIPFNGITPEMLNLVQSKRKEELPKLGTGFGTRILPIPQTDYALNLLAKKVTDASSVAVMDKKPELAKQ
ncbi:MAG: hypothetical protein WC589_24580 [Sphingobacterium sp.]